MAEAALGAGGRRVSGSLVWAIAWRSLWRNRRRTWLSAGGVAFATALVLFSMSIQVGSYSGSIEIATGFFAGHLQIQNQEYIEQGRLEQTIGEATALVRALEARPDILAVAPRVGAFALASVDERSFGVQVFGIDVQRERRTVSFFDRIVEGGMADGGDEVVIGSILARNLNAGVGDEVVVLGAGVAGGVAAAVVRVAGILHSGLVDFDRSLMLAPLATVQNTFGLGDEVHVLAVRSADVARSGQLVEALNAELPAGVVARNWDAVLPQVKQGIELDWLGSLFVYGIVMVVVTFSVVNTFIMTVFERTREFGMLRAVGLRPGALMGMVQLEALCIWLLGVGMAVAVLAPLIAWLSHYGIYLGEEITEIAQAMFLPDRLYPELSGPVLLTAPLLMFAGVQLAAFIPSLKIRRLQPVAALRTE